MKASDWQMGWFRRTCQASPCNLAGRKYNGTNSFFLLLSMMDNDKFIYPVFATFNQIKNAGGSVLKGEKSFPVLFWSFLYKGKDGNKITEEEFDAMSRNQKKECHITPILRSYNVFNIAQTDLENTAPQLMDKIRTSYGIIDEMPTDTFGMYENPAMDDMLTYQKWLCPIHYDNFSNRACYRPSTDEITIPLKTQFKKSADEEGVFADGQEYYATILHEMAHSTGNKNRLKRKIEGDKNDYAREELVAELTAALIGNTLGFSSRIIDNNAAYLDAWITTLKAKPKFILSVMSDVTKAANMIMDVIAIDSVIHAHQSVAI